MKSAVHVDANSVADIIFQPASLDIWEAKYRLTAKDGTRVDETIDDTFKRVARALADVEEEPLRDKYFDEFLWALRSGAIPAGRIISNAGAQEHKPATSTINCTVSGTVADSMDNILNKVHEAGLTLKAGCGIGYEFFHPEAQRGLRYGCGRVHVGAAVVYGYLRQDVFHGLIGRGPARCADGYVRCRPSGRHGFHTCET